MTQLEVYCRGICRGEASVTAEEGRMGIDVTMEDPGDGLYRASLVGAVGRLALGVLEPGDGRLTLRRRPSRSDVERLGTLLRVQAECSFPFRKSRVWHRSEKPAELVDSRFLTSRLAVFSQCWWRREEERLILALPWGEGERFPLEPLFCFGRVSVVEGQRCIVYTFDSRDEPL